MPIGISVRANKLATISIERPDPEFPMLRTPPKIPNIPHANEIRMKNV
jgi:hypothetical protein